MKRDLAVGAAPSGSEEENIFALNVLSSILGRHVRRGDPEPEKTICEILDWFYEDINSTPRKRRTARELLNKAGFKQVPDGCGVETLKIPRTGREKTIAFLEAGARERGISVHSFANGLLAKLGN
ncbi:MAG: hypothetical protein ABIK07_20915 [Planctomycetota bacterium]